MEDIFYFQKIYSLNNNYNILDFKKILEKKNIILSLDKLKLYFIDEINNNINNDNYFTDIYQFLNKYDIFYFENIYDYISKFKFNYIDNNLIDFNFIKFIYKINDNDEILKNIYDNSINIKIF